MRLNVWAKTDVGRKRKINQDAILLDYDLKLFIVADGMGGHKGGEVASALASEALREVVRDELKKGELEPEDIFIKGYKVASRRVYDEAQKPGDEDLRGMGTTMVAILIHNRVAHIANVGDSRAYVYRDDLLWRITEDHSLVNEQLRAGIISESELDEVTGKNVITRSVGFEFDVEVDVFHRELIGGEKYLLCSDGLYGMVPDEWIQERIGAGPSESLVADCIVEANEQGGDDNVSCLFLEVEP